MSYKKKEQAYFDARDAEGKKKEEFNVSKVM